MVLTGRAAALQRLVLGAAETLFPGYFALVMATGITAIACHLLGLGRVAEALVAVDVVAYGVLAGLTLLRAVRFPARLAADFTDPARGPGFFTLVAGTCVLGNELLVVEGARRAASLLWDLGLALWLVVMYGFLLAVVTARRKPALEDALNGSWLIAAVATQAVAILSLLLADGAPKPEHLLFLALSFFLLGCFLYLVLITIIFQRLAFLRLDPAALTPPYWINMGAVAITTLAGALLVLHEGEWALLRALHPFVAGLTLLFWSVATWWIPLLVALSLWRHAVRRVPLRYDPQLWGMAFPLGMYTVATFRLAAALDLPVLAPVPAVSVYVALAVWTLLALGLAAELWRGAVRALAAAAALALAVLGAAPPVAARPAEPVFSNDGWEAAQFGAAEGYPLGNRATMNERKHLVATYSHFDELFRARRVARAGPVSPLKRAPEELTLTYRYEGRLRTLEDYLDRHPTTGLLIARGDTILFEHYRYGRGETDRFLSQSMAKTITAMLIGIAVADGAIASIDQSAAAYVPELAGSAYGATSIRALLHMASGVAFSETYDGKDDLAAMGRALFRPGSPGAAEVVRQFDRREAPPGTRFQYASVETEVLGLVLRKAVKMPLADYAHEKLWSKLGAEADATWIIDAAGQETAYCCFNAMLRDYARLGLMLAHDGAWNGQQIVPRDWVVAATSVEAPYLAPRTATPGMGYGYQTWIFPESWRQFALLGVRGQSIFVDPPSKLVLVHTAVRLMPSRDPGALELAALWRALVAAKGG